MATVTLGGNPTNTNGELPVIGSKAPEFKLVDANLGEISLANYAGQNVILNIFPSVDTATCATSVRTFNKLASELPNTKVLCISRDYPLLKNVFVVPKVLRM